MKIKEDNKNEPSEMDIFLRMQNICLRYRIINRKCRCYPLSSVLTCDGK